MRLFRWFTIFFTSIFFLTIAGSFVFAADSAVRGVLDHTAPSSGLHNACGSTSCIPTIVGGLINVVLGLLGVALIGYVVYAGYLWMTSGGESKQVEEAQTVLRNAVIGIVIIGFSYTLTGVGLRFVQSAFNPSTPDFVPTAPTTPTTPTTPTAPVLVDPIRPGCVVATCASECEDLTCNTLTGQRRFTCESSCQTLCTNNCSRSADIGATTPAPACDTNACETTCMTSRCPAALGTTDVVSHSGTAGSIFGVGGAETGTVYDTSPEALACRSDCHTECTASLCPTAAPLRTTPSTCSPMADYRQCLANCTTDITERAGRGEFTGSSSAQGEALDVCNNDCSFLYCR